MKIVSRSNNSYVIELTVSEIDSLATGDLQLISRLSFRSISSPDTEIIHFYGELSLSMALEVLKTRGIHE